MSSRLLKKDCDICGFTYFKNELLLQSGLYKCRSCYDTPKPSNKSLGGQGEITKGGDFREDWTSYDEVNPKTVHTIDGSGTLPYSEVWMYVVGTLSTIVHITDNTQIGQGSKHGNTLCLEGRSDSNAVRFYHGSGLILNNSQDAILYYGDVLNLYYDTMNSLNKWVETSRTKY